MDFFGILHHLAKSLHQVSDAQTFVVSQQIGEKPPSFGIVINYKLYLYEEVAFSLAWFIHMCFDFAPGCASESSTIHEVLEWNRHSLSSWNSDLRKRDNNVSSHRFFVLCRGLWLCVLGISMDLIRVQNSQYVTPLGPKITLPASNFRIASTIRALRSQDGKSLAVEISNSAPAV